MYPQEPCQDGILKGKNALRLRRERRIAKELPPPMPPRGALEKHYTCDGRLVIIESDRLPDIIRSRRENNRLTIDLISLEEIYDEGESSDEAANDQTMEKVCDLGVDGRDGGSENQKEDEGKEPVRNGEDDFETEVIDGKSEDRIVEEETVRAYRYDYGVRSNPCMVGIAVPAVRHIWI